MTRSNARSSPHTTLPVGSRCEAFAWSNPIDTQIILITGAGSGVGRATSLELQKLGHTVVLAGRRRHKLEETQSLCMKNGGETLVVPTDVADPDSVEQLFEQLIQQFSRLDVLFNNAGVSAPEKPIDELTFEEWKYVVDINLHGSFLCASRAVSQMKQQKPRGGRIINNGSIAAHTPRPMSVAYAATKHAITGLTKAISLDGRHFDIACGQIDIGNAESEMRGKEASRIQANGSKVVEPVIKVKHVADAVVQIVSLPLDANIQSMTIMATKMPYVGRG
ncbi:MAG: SDR family oxidoreductase [Pirellulales bacterium]|nr:SDR family oxidoreductase [Pirellulales bacterium]